MIHQETKQPHLSLSLSIYVSNYLSIRLSAHLSLSLCIHPSIFLFVNFYLSIFVSVCLCIHIFLATHLSIYFSISLSICLSVYLSSGHLSSPPLLSLRLLRRSVVIHHANPLFISMNFRVPLSPQSLSLHPCFLS